MTQEDLGFVLALPIMAIVLIALYTIVLFEKLKGE